MALIFFFGEEEEERDELVVVRGGGRSVIPAVVAGEGREEGLSAGGKLEERFLKRDFTTLLRFLCWITLLGVVIKVVKLLIYGFSKNSLREVCFLTC